MSKLHIEPARLDAEIKLMEAEMRLGFKPKNWEHVFMETNIARMPPDPELGFVKLHEIKVDRVWIAHWQYLHPDDWNRYRSSDPRTGCQIALSVKSHRDHVEGKAEFCRDCIKVFVERAIALDYTGVP